MKKKNKIIDWDLLLCIFLSILLEFFLECCDWRSISKGLEFLDTRTWVFFFNCGIIFSTYLFIFFFRKKCFVYVIVTTLWAAIGIVNYTMLGYRNTPFSAVDITLAKSTLPVINNYMSNIKIAMLIVGIMILIALLVCFFLYGPVVERKKSLWKAVLLMMVTFCMIYGSAVFGVQKGLIEKRFGNIRLAYRAYGTPYCFTITMLSSGIEMPPNYSGKAVKNIQKKVEKKLKQKKTVEKQTPNIIFLQLESFFDVTKVKGLTFSQNPIPYFKQYQKKFSSGYVKVPSYGAGTANTEFEMITGMNLNYFGVGEYPYKTVLQTKTCESIPYLLKQEGYATHAIHNNNATFYDRDLVFSHLGFDTFTTAEFMNIYETTANGWAKDKVLTKEILKSLRSTEEQDYIYTISVQGHGEYPDCYDEDAYIRVSGAETEELNNQYTYYANQIHEMDVFLQDLIVTLEENNEPTVLVVYGDHLPSLNIENDDLTYKSKYKTSYFIWDNIGLEKKDETVEAYQLGSKVLESLGITDGFLNQYHQTMKKTKKYRSNLKMLQYDMLYGNQYIYGMENPYPATDLVFGTQKVWIMNIEKDEINQTAIIRGANFTPFSKVVINGKEIETTYVDKTTLEIALQALGSDCTIAIRQKSKTNQHPILAESDSYQYNEQREPNTLMKQEEQEQEQ